MKLILTAAIMFFMIPVIHNHHTDQVPTKYRPSTGQVITEEIELLARLVFAEAGGESFQGQWAVADVVVYISNSLRWSVKRTIQESGKFDGVHSAMYRIKTKDIPQSCLRAAKRAIEGKHILPAGMWYFFNPRTASDHFWINQIPMERTMRIGNHVFCCRPRHTA